MLSDRSREWSNRVVSYEDGSLAIFIVGLPVGAFFELLQQSWLTILVDYGKIDSILVHQSIPVGGAVDDADIVVPDLFRSHMHMQIHHWLK